ncbi:hypothetical protein Kpol_1060p50 [Vanderwaltozyma polyspora DSM 70294]|uniref:Uncharacterized protein n=1 Tax=Vanderwaltozyma polyspora (strain ATCC 22028 / DSM 70294 / BCRC 21397 / CBS 2163 / NBRC 10782 / NRRL Y-8283 / UCD 57-17) TaxID=436907 RepID=A7TK48_VANPO|nr:uncharacterized protein Kpol_1060p50 [Vanderwaltozyma polyspora DSM 70294]EDO17394.1 hypothetical protein Kpol_1060p50 [Vanderwaltozyma polyspora DSM 70294]
MIKSKVSSAGKKLYLNEASLIKNIYDHTSQIVKLDTKPISIEDLSKCEAIESDELALPLEYQVLSVYKKKLKGNNPIKEAVAQLRGIHSPVQKFRTIYRVFNKESMLYKCKYFRLTYFPTDHFLCLYRKSRPAINVMTSNPLIFNGNFPRKDDDNSVPLENAQSELTKKFRTILRRYPSIDPRDYAYIRTMARNSIRIQFIKTWCNLNGDKAVEEAIEYGLNKSKKTSASLESFKDEKKKYSFIDSDGQTLEGVAKDGYYQYQVFKFPDRKCKKEFEACVRESVSAVAKLSWSDILKCKGTDKNISWVERTNSSLNISALNKMLKGQELPTLLRK